MKIGKLKIGSSEEHILLDPKGTSSWVGRHGGKLGAAYDHLTYKPFKGAKRGYYYRLPWNKNKLIEDMAKKMK